MEGFPPMSPRRRVEGSDPRHEDETNCNFQEPKTMLRLCTSRLHVTLQLFEDDGWLSLRWSRAAVGVG